MKVKVTMSDKEKKWTLAFIVLAAIILYFVNKLYLFILDVEFEDSKPSKLLLKTGFLIPIRTVVDLGDNESITKVKFYNYRIKATPVIDNDTKVATGEYIMQIYKGKSDKVFKSVTIHTDDYYVQYLKTPLGRI
jgi:hypothetical protein